ncbi:MAG: hypothetical protein MUF34_28625 [Polyangiaceae bacterium]|nr:hypothetical protein [Polyangiaceae bacterium]
MSDLLARAKGLEGDVLENVDGGQPGVERRSRPVVWVGRELWLAHRDHGNGPDGRPLVGGRVVGWFDLGALALPGEAYVPEGADLSD